MIRFVMDTCITDKFYREKNELTDDKRWSSGERNAIEHDKQVNN